MRRRLRCGGDGKGIVLRALLFELDKERDDERRGHDYRDCVRDGGCPKRAHYTEAVIAIAGCPTACKNTADILMTQVNVTNIKKMRNSLEANSS